MMTHCKTIRFFNPLTSEMSLFEIQLLFNCLCDLHESVYSDAEKSGFAPLCNMLLIISTKPLFSSIQNQQILIDCLRYFAAVKCCMSVQRLLFSLSKYAGFKLNAQMVEKFGELKECGAKTPVLKG